VYAVVTSVAACQPGGGSQEPVPDQRIGTFDFILRYRSSTFGGTIKVGETAMAVDATDGLCVPSHQMQFSDEILAFECSGLADVDKLTLAIRRQYPAGRARWSGQVSRQVTNRVCTSYGKDDKGNAICISYENVTSYVIDNVGGDLQLKWKAPTD
jgi:hypothetical protein